MSVSYRYGTVRYGTVVYYYISASFDVAGCVEPVRYGTLPYGTVPYLYCVPYRKSLAAQLLAAASFINR